MPEKYTNIGTTLSVSTGVPATVDIAGYAALTYTEVTGVATVPEIGPSAAVVSQADLKDGVVLKGHGEIDFGGGTVQMRDLPTDTGQGMLKTAQSTQGIISVKVTRSTGLIEYFRAIVMSYRRSEAGTGNFPGIAADLQIISAIVPDATSV